MTQKDNGSENRGEPEQDDEVGYGRPPRHSRFKPGQSGNPGGRPKGAKTRKSKHRDERLKELVLQEAYREVVVQDNGQDLPMPVAQAALRSLAIQAAKGNPRAAKLFLEIVQVTEAANRKRHELWLETVIDYKVGWEWELERRMAEGITYLPDPIPHPDDILIDFENDTVTIVGPMTKEEKAARDQVITLREDLEDEIRWCLEEIDTTEDPETQNRMKETIALNRRILARIDRMLGLK